MTGSVSWRWLATCQDCGRVHVWRWHDPTRQIEGGTWADPDDRHAYRPRLGTTDIIRLQALRAAEAGGRP